MYEFGEVSGLLCTESLMCDCCNLLGYPFKLLCSFSEIHIFVGHYVTCHMSFQVLMVQQAAVQEVRH